jgi:hypothetical protein
MLDFKYLAWCDLEPLSDLRFSLDLFPDRSAIAPYQTLIKTSKPLADHALFA